MTKSSIAGVHAFSSLAADIVELALISGAGVRANRHSSKDERRWPWLAELPTSKPPVALAASVAA